MLCPFTCVMTALMNSDDVPGLVLGHGDEALHAGQQRSDLQKLELKAVVKKVAGPLGEP